MADPPRPPLSDEDGARDRLKAWARARWREHISRPRLTRGQGLRRAWTRVLITLGAMSLVALGLNAIDDFVVRRDLRIERELESIERRVAEETPSAAWFEFLSVDPVAVEIHADEPLTMQSNGVVRRAVNYERNAQLQCQPIAGGPYRQVDATTERIRRAAAEVIGDVVPPPILLGARRSPGLWDWNGKRPERDSRCYLLTQRCFSPYAGVERCQPELRSPPFILRAARRGT